MGYSWIVEFRQLFDIIISEYEKGNKRYCVIRFKCGGPPLNRPEIDTPRVEEKEHDENEENDANSENVDDGSLSTVPHPSQFPLAQLCQNADSLVGKEIRLGFMRKTSNPKDSYAFAWPGIVNLLGGLPFPYKKGQVPEYQLPLDDWAMKNKERLEPFRLIEYPSKELGRIVWHLLPKRTQSVFDLLIGTKELTRHPDELLCRLLRHSLLCRLPHHSLFGRLLRHSLLCRLPHHFFLGRLLRHSPRRRSLPHSLRRRLHHPPLR